MQRKPRASKSPSIRIPCGMLSPRICSKPASISAAFRSCSVMPTWKTTARYLQVADVAVRSTPSPLDALDLQFSTKP
jgi:hypothetical protein